MMSLLKVAPEMKYPVHHAAPQSDAYKIKLGGLHTQLQVEDKAVSAF